MPRERPRRAAVASSCPAGNRSAGAALSGLTDEDGDPSTATVTINLADDSEPTIDNETGEVDEEALSDGSNPTSDAETTTGTFNIDMGDDGLDTFVIDGIDTTLPLHRRLMEASDFANGLYDIHWLERFVTDANQNE